MLPLNGQKTFTLYRHFGGACWRIFVSPFREDAATDKTAAGRPAMGQTLRLLDLPDLHIFSKFICTQPQSKLFGFSILDVMIAV